MRSDDEKFLRDLAWSEAWLPWRKENAIYVRERETHFWEPFAVIVSTLALLVSAFATYGTWLQVDVMKEQLGIADRNRALQTAVEDIFQYCDHIAIPYVKPAMFYFRRADGSRYIASADGSMSGEEAQKAFKDYYIDVGRRLQKMKFSSISLLQWLPPSEKFIAESVIRDMNALTGIKELSVAIQNGTAPEVLRSDAVVCLNIYNKLVNTVSGFNFLEMIDPEDLDLIAPFNPPTD
ncbi:hypothetical protein DXM29_09540 [Agrobacterium tumefaciens]|uniref:hypothetical protein n=1 Tax=Agrobacterium tumefaciens TaxID=358 RepID=UPI00123011F5|nr:hypothetical protein DXM29_09540 [Agrobacterium tumefaciens]